MFKVKTEIKQSSIDGLGVFAAEDITEGAVVWQYADGYDRKMTTEDFDGLDEDTKESLKRIAYLSEQTGLWVIPPDNDSACYTNHSKNANTKKFLKSEISEEVIFVASCDIRAGEEITNNYLEFDPNANKKTQAWL